MKPKIEKNLKETCANALQQIRDKHYINDLLKNGVAENNIYVYGFAFKGQKVLVYGGAFVDLNTQKN